MTWLSQIALISAILGFVGYLFQILMIIGCCDKHMKLQVSVFRFTVISMSIAVISSIAFIAAK